MGRRADPCFTMSLRNQNPVPRRSARRLQTCIFLSIAIPQMQDGGARRDRTDDLMLAKHPLYQLSYGPVRVEPSGHTLCELVG